MKCIAAIFTLMFTIMPTALAQQGSNPSQATCALTSGGTAATNALAKFTSPCNVEASAISDAAGRVGVGGTNSSTRFYVTDTQTNFGSRWLLHNVFPTTVSKNGTNYGLGLDSDVSNMSVSPGVTDSGYRIAIRGLGHADTLNIAGTLTTQWGLLSQAGINRGASGAKVGTAYGGEFVVLNRVPGTTITNAYGVYISNSDTSGTITNRYDLYASSANAKSYFAGNLGIGTIFPGAKLDVMGAGETGLTANFEGGTTGVFAAGTTTGVQGSGYTGVTGSGSIGVYGYGFSGTGVEGDGTYGIIGRNTEGVSYGGYFEGDVLVTGNLAKGSGSFKIDHPLDPANKYLQHSFVESPDMMNVYNGNIVLDRDGTAWITLPHYFEALNRDFRYQLTAIGAPGPNLYVAQKVTNNRFQIAGGQPGSEVSWQVTGIRQDPYAKAHPIVAEVEKKADEKGKYLHAAEFGQPESMGIRPSHAPKHNAEVPEQRN